MRKRLLPLCLAVVCFFALCSQVFALVPLDPAAPAGLTLYYQKDEKAFSGLQVEIYRVAEAFPDGKFQLIAPYAGYPVNIHDITDQQQWKNIASTLSAYIVADQLTPDATVQTDGQGVARFENLQTGLYLVCRVVAEEQEGTYIFDQFMVYLPTPQTDGTYRYQVEAKPKCTQFTPNTQYTVTKLWQDDQTDRPQAVTVDIYRDGVLQQTQQLSKDNNWSYTWYVSADDPGQWTVAEREVPAGYKVSIRQNGNVFSVINTRQSHTDTPQTGDTFTPLPWVLALCLSGMVLLLLGIYGRRRK